MYEKNQRITEEQIENSEVVAILKFLPDYGEKNLLFSLNFAWNGHVYLL